MCGIVGYAGKGNASSVIWECLKRLEYRGYDSAGIGVTGKNRIRAIKDAGRIKEVESRYDIDSLDGMTGIGHTRWATHGVPSRRNAHPHFSPSRKIAVVHNGIIENYAELRDGLRRQGYKFRSDTDTEVIAHLIERYHKGNTLEALGKALARLKGTYAILAINSDEPDKVFFARNFSPLIIGVGSGEMFACSDVPAFLKHTRRVVYVEDGEYGFIDSSGVTILRDGRRKSPRVHEVEWSPGLAEKEGYDYFMLKEIYEQPRALEDTLMERNGELEKFVSALKRARRVYLCACGSSYHAAITGKYLFERLCSLPCYAEMAHELRFRADVLDRDSVFLAISQSGETADTLAAARAAKKKGAKILSIVNVVGSSLSRISDAVLYTRAGPEISVVATKSFTTQLALLYKIALAFSGDKGLERELDSLPKLVRDTIRMNDKETRRLARLLKSKEDFYFIGMGFAYPSALEGALKLKEISYLHGEGLPAGELKHGTLALITQGVPVVAIVPKTGTYAKMAGSIREVGARKGYVISVADKNDRHIPSISRAVLRIPGVSEPFSTLLSIIPLQLLAYYMTLERGNDPDRPRNLAKSVTVE